MKKNLLFFENWCITEFVDALVAQLDRVLPSEGKGREFESRQARHINTGLPGVFFMRIGIMNYIAPLS